MKTRSILFILYLLVSPLAFAQDINFVTYNENFSQDTASVRNAPLRAKAMRKAKNHGGEIVLNYISSVPDSIRDAIEVAKLLWEECLPCKVHIKIDVKFSTNTSEMTVIVPYKSIQYVDTLYPASYYETYIANNATLDNHGTVIFSDAVNWCCKYINSNSANQKNISTAMLRAIARVLGFGSTIVGDDHNRVYFQNSKAGCTPFEHLIYNDEGIPLTSIPRGRSKNDNVDLHRYCQTGNLWLKWVGNQFKLYAPAQFESDKSLVLLDEPGSLMHHNMPAGSNYLDIDSTTKEILKAIGWDFENNPPVEIYCQDIPSTGITSVYNPYIFEIRNLGANISSIHWEYQVKSNNGEYHTVSQQLNGQTFLVNPSDFLSESHINPEGDIDGMICMTYNLNNEEITAYFKLTFECAPKIISIYDKMEHDCGYITYFDYSFNVSYRGATSVTIGVEEEYNPYYKIIQIDEPILAHAYLKYINRGRMTWVDVSVTNEYGTDMQTIEFPVQHRSYAKELPSGNIDCEIKNNDINYIDIYSLDGTFLKRVKSISELKDYHTCTLLLKYFNSDKQQIYTKKINLK